MTVVQFSGEYHMMPKEKFLSEIEKRFLKTENYMEAIVEYCADKDIEIESVKKYIDPNLLIKLQTEASGLHLIKREYMKPNIEDLV